MFNDIGFVFKSPLRLKVANYFIRRPGEWNSAADVASTLGTTRQAASKEVSQLVRFGILSSKRVESEVRYSVNTSDNLFESLYAFLGSVTNPTDKEIVESLRGIRGITLVVAAGLFTDETKSPAELLIVGKNPDEKKIDRVIKKLEAMIALPVRYVVMDADEYYDRRQAYDRMLRDLFEFKHRIILDKSA